MPDDDLQATVLRVLTEVAPEIDGRKLDPGKNIRDQMDFDSVDFLNFALALEKELGIPIPEADYPKLSSLSGCLAYIEQARKAAATSG